MGGGGTCVGGLTETIQHKNMTIFPQVINEIMTLFVNIVIPYVA